MCDVCDQESRRNFLKTALGAVAGVAILPAWALANDSGHAAPPKPKAKKPTEGHEAPAKPAEAAHGEPAAHHAPVGPGITPDEALARLLEGNRRYVSNKAFCPNESSTVRTKLATGQAPFAIILGCSDSRVPPEVVFDFGLGDLFVIRVAGNIVEDAGVGSIEYAIEHLGTPLVVVLGHERCGAVKATIETLEAGADAPGHIGELVRKLKPAVEASAKTPGDKVANAVRENVRRMVSELAGLEPFLKEKVEAGKVKVVGAHYDLDSGVVELLS
jgi:carbonic anhydrase